MRRHFLRNSCGAQRFVGFFVVVDCDFRELIGWAELQSRGTGLLVQVFFKCLPFPACLPHFNKVLSSSSTEKHSEFITPPAVHTNAFGISPHLTEIFHKIVFLSYRLRFFCDINLQDIINIFQFVSNTRDLNIKDGTRLNNMDIAW